MYLFSAFLVFYQNTYAWLHTHVKDHHTMKIITIWIIQYLSLKFIPFRFYIWNMAKTKSLSLVVKKWYPNYEYALENLILFITKGFFPLNTHVKIFGCRSWPWGWIRNLFSLLKGHCLKRFFHLWLCVV
jgi:hypothetical protein